MSAELAHRHDDRRSRLRLVTASGTGVPDVPDREHRATAREVREMSRVAAHLRRRARRLPEDSPVRDELLETAEYYAAAADEHAATQSPRHG